MQDLEIGPDDGGQRVDRFLRKYLPSATLGHVFKLLRTGRVRVNGSKSKPEARLQEGDVMAFRMPEERLEALRTTRKGSKSAPESRSAGAVRVLYRDDHLLAVDKPPFLLVQPAGRKGEPSLDYIVRGMLGPSGAATFQPSLAHRLDRGTSGVVLFGLTSRGLRELTSMFRDHRITKRYLALCEGRTSRMPFLIDEPLLRESAGEGQGAHVRVSSAPAAQPAATEVDPLARSPNGRLTLVEARPLSGRTHQIRVHLRSRGLPVVGDSRYGRPRTNREARAESGLWRPFLHAACVELTHPVSGEPLRIESPLPQDLVRALGWAKISVEQARPGGEDGGP